jgi:hypothetical protein
MPSSSQPEHLDLVPDVVRGDEPLPGQEFPHSGFHDLVVPRLRVSGYGGVIVVVMVVVMTMIVCMRSAGHHARSSQVS